MECTTLTKCQATCKKRRVAMANSGGMMVAAWLLGSVSLLISNVDKGGTGIKSRPSGFPNKVPQGATLISKGGDETLHANTSCGCSIVTSKRLGKAWAHNIKHASPSIAGHGIDMRIESRPVDITLFAAYSLPAPCIKEKYTEYRTACREITDWIEKLLLRHLERVHPFSTSTQRMAFV